MSVFKSKVLTPKLNALEQKNKHSNMTEGRLVALF